MPLFQTSRPPAKEEANFSDEAHNGGWELSVRTPGDLMVVHDNRGAEEGTRQLPSMDRWMALIALAFMWTGAQAPLYLFAGAPVYIYRDLGGLHYWVRFVTANLLATAAISPFVGALSDLMGRRYVAIIGSATILLGQVICGAANGMPMFISGMAITGVGTGINELTALAGTAELVPLSKRGYHIAGMVLSVLPFLPSVMYAQLIAYHSTWRYISVLTAVWTLVGLIATVAFYFPPTRVQLQTWKEKSANGRIPVPLDKHPDAGPLHSWSSVDGFVRGLAAMRVGGITILVSTIITIICPGDVIATVTALTMAVRIVGGAVGYAVYFNVFVGKLVPDLTALVGAACARAGIVDGRVVGEAIRLTSVSLVKEIRHLPGVADDRVWADIVAAGQLAYANAYPWVYYCSVAFGAVAVVASLFLGNTSVMVDDTVVAAM
ncbi:MFS general substrate transporter [Parathielavia hyrcaniae]|uniref:MFS general substrate transporter n=1 Tax=Parathielavia hyrcaniae TaxID=113614 RepID=A0AAN6Q848_9PEZI|nr:MFS general substrate transporter [Parathielavia hyrcaniae]